MNDTVEIFLPRIEKSLVQTNLETHLVNYFFQNNIKTPEELLREYMKNYSRILRMLEPNDQKKVITAFFSLN